MATKSIEWNDGSGDYIRLTYSGSGNDTTIIESDANNTASARSKVITIETTAGNPVVTKNLTVNQAACPFPVGQVNNYSYTGNYQEVELPAGKYKLQCWGAQGGSNGTNSSYGITAKSGGKGGYSEGVIILSQKTTVRVYVGGQGSSSAGGFNGGGSTTGTSQYNSGDTFGYSKMGGGGGATDIRLSDGALLSRMIVAGGGSGGAMCYKAVTTTTTTWNTLDTLTPSSAMFLGYSVRVSQEQPSDYLTTIQIFGNPFQANQKLRFTYTYNPTFSFSVGLYNGNSRKLEVVQTTVDGSGVVEATLPSTLPAHDRVRIFCNCSSGYWNGTITVDEGTTTTSTNTSTDSQVGFAGGGTTGVGYSSSYYGKQNAAGSGGSFGQGANQTTTNYRFCSGAGGGGWYGGGGGQKSDSTMTYCKYSGGGSGWVNIAANAGNRPSGYTGIELDSGTTYDGNSSFPSTNGGTETGHSGNGYARITRLE